MKNSVIGLSLGKKELGGLTSLPPRSGKILSRKGGGLARWNACFWRVRILPSVFLLMQAVKSFPAVQGP